MADNRLSHMQGHIYYMIGFIKGGGPGEAGPLVGVLTSLIQRGNARLNNQERNQGACGPGMRKHGEARLLTTINE